MLKTRFHACAGRTLGLQVENTCRAPHAKDNGSKAVCTVVAHQIHWGNPGLSRNLVDGQAGEGYDGVDSPLFSTDGRHVAYAAQKGEKWMVILDGRTVGEYDAICKTTPAFDTNGVLEYLAIKANSLSRVNHIPAKQSNRIPFHLKPGRSLQEVA